MKFKILIYGCGQIGSRHLQSLVDVTAPLDISIYDDSIPALNAAKIRWDEALLGCNQSSHCVTYAQTLNQISNEIDLAIVATRANERIPAILSIKASHNVKYWIFEKVLAQSLHDLIKLEDLVGSTSCAWVNTPRRMWSLYRNLKSQFLHNKKLNISIKGVDGLACNAIHFIDLASFLTDSDPISIDITQLAPDWFRAKRAGFYEVQGELSIQYQNKSILKISGRKVGNDKLQARISSCNNEWYIDEDSKKAVSAIGVEIKGDCELQSQLTSKLVEDIINTDCCSLLPELQQSVRQHKVFLEALLKHWNMNSANTTKILPIT